MPKTKLQKQEILRTLSEKIKGAKSIVFTEFNALGVKDNEELRSKLRENGSEYFVAKKTLIDIALKNEKIDNVDVRGFEGKVAIVFGNEDEVAPAKALADFQKTHKDKINFVGGILDGNFISGVEVTALSKMPSKIELYAKLVGSLNSPISGFVNVLAGNIRGLLYALKAIEEKKA